MDTKGPFRLDHRAPILLLLLTNMRRRNGAMKTTKSLNAVLAMVLISGCGGGSPAETQTPSGDQPRYKVTIDWCEQIDYEALAKTVNGEVLFPSAPTGELISKIQLVCDRTIFDIPPGNGMISARVIAYTYQTVELAKDRSWKYPSPPTEVPQLAAKVDQATFAKLAKFPIIRILDSNLTFEVRIVSLPTTAPVPVEVLVDFADHVLEVIRANPLCQDLVRHPMG